MTEAMWGATHFVTRAQTCARATSIMQATTALLCLIHVSHLPILLALMDARVTEWNREVHGEEVTETSHVRLPNTMTLEIRDTIHTCRVHKFMVGEEMQGTAMFVARSLGTPLQGMR